jgi:hypothetical protein
MVTLIQNHGEGMITKSELRPKALKKLKLAAQIIKKTAGLYDGDTSVLPLWGAGVITHGQPNSKKLEIGVSKNAKGAPAKDTTRDHLHRVTKTAEYLLERAANLTVDEIEDILLQRSITMRVTRSENNAQLKRAIKQCDNKDDWRELYKMASVEYELYS